MTPELEEDLHLLHAEKVMLGKTTEKSVIAVMERHQLDPEQLAEALCEYHEKHFT